MFSFRESASLGRPVSLCEEFFSFSEARVKHNYENERWRATGPGAHLNFKDVIKPLNGMSLGMLDSICHRDFISNEIDWSLFGESL